MKLSLSIALRFLRAGRGQTVLIIAGISIAVAAQVFIGLLIGSLQKTLVDRTIGNQPQITVSPVMKDATIAEWQAIAATIDQTGLVESISAAATGNAFVSAGSRTAPALVRGLTQEADGVYGLRDAVYEGDWVPSDAGLLIGKELREDLGLEIKDPVALQTPAGKTATFAVTGFFDLGVAQVNRSWVITSTGSAQALFGYGGGVTSIEMTVADPFQADKIAGRLTSELSGQPISITDWKALNEQLLSGLQGQSISSLMIQVFIVVSVVIAISAILAITVFQKSRQLGILKAMGIKDRAASLIFVFEGLVIGLLGSFMGIVIGLVLLYGFSAGTSQSAAGPLIDLHIDYRFVFVSWAIAVVASVVAALIPARRSLRLNPIEVIREG
jgi:lipoprotein-releasing system permease protein